VTNQLDYLPALTGRSTLATIEHAIPYHTSYFRQIEERLEAGLLAVAAPDPRVLADYVRRYEIDVIAVDRSLLAGGELPARWATVVPGAVRNAEQQLRKAPSFLQRRAPACTLHEGELVLLDAACLVRA
jgi:hypothetical protein